MAASHGRPVKAKRARRVGKGMAGIFFDALKGFFTGMTVGLLLALLSASWIWLEMRMNTGLMISVMTLVCLAMAVWKGAIFNYKIFLFSQVLLAIAFVFIYGFDPVALHVVPACLFREGFQIADISLDNANIIIVAVLFGGNVFMPGEAVMKKRCVVK
jgi:hypothetical protein